MGQTILVSKWSSRQKKDAGQKPVLVCADHVLKSCSIFQKQLGSSSAVTSKTECANALSMGGRL